MPNAAEIWKSPPASPFNPDFSQVETDSAQLNVNETFALYFPEKRPFFLENADYFRTRLNLIHTRTIADPDYGLRLVGKTGRNAWGTFFTNDNLTTVLLPGTFGSNLISLGRESLDFAGRFRHDLPNSSTVGGLVTHRSAAGYHNTVFSADSRYRWSDSITLSGQHSVILIPISGLTWALSIRWVFANPLLITATAGLASPGAGGIASTPLPTGITVRQKTTACWKTKSSAGSL